MDIVQTLFVELISSPSRSLELPYLYSAVNNRCLNLIRNQRNRSRLLAGGEHALPERQYTSLDGTMLHRDLFVRLLQMLDKKSADIVLYHYLDDMNQDEVAVQMGMSRRAVVKRLAKIRVQAHSLSRAASQSEAPASEETSV